MTGDGMNLIEMIRDSASSIAPRGGNLSRIRSLRFSAPGFDLAVHRQIAAMGWIGLRLPEAHGGVGLGMAESVALHEELGRALVPEPLIAAMLSATLLASVGHPALEGLLSGNLIIPTAWADRADSLTSSADRRATRRGVVAADVAQHVLVPAGDSLRLVDAVDVTIDAIALQDGGRLFNVAIRPEAGQILGRGPGRVVARALDEAALDTAAYLLGVAEQAFAMTLDYLKQRRQFGQTLGSFQALQHRAADLKIELTLTRASILSAAADLDRGASELQRALAVSRAKARASDTALLVGREAIQLHGAIGYTDEYDVGLFTRKAMAVANQYGSALAHRQRYRTLAGQVRT